MSLPWHPLERTLPKDTLLAEEHPLGATLILKGEETGWCISCTLGRTFEHRAGATTESEARKKFEAMKADLSEILEGSDSAPCDERFRMFADTY